VDSVALAAVANIKPCTLSFGQSISISLRATHQFSGHVLKMFLATRDGATRRIGGL